MCCVTFSQVRFVGSVINWASQITFSSDAEVGCFFFVNRSKTVSEDQLIIISISGVISPAIWFRHPLSAA